MRIHSNTLEFNDIRDAMHVARVLATTLDRKGSRKRDHAFGVKLSGNSPFRQNGGSEYAATWDQWGIFLAELYRRDPDMIAAAYDRSAWPGELETSADIFHYATGHRFTALRFEQSHRKHNWQPNFDYTSHCDCGAVQRWDHLMGSTNRVAVSRVSAPKVVDPKPRFDFDNLISDIDKLIDWQMSESPAAKAQFA